MNKEVEVNVLKGLIITDIIIHNNVEDKYGNYDHEIIFKTGNGRQFRMFHQQECCEQVRIISIEIYDNKGIRSNGLDIVDFLLGSTISKTIKKETRNWRAPWDSQTNTEFTFETGKGKVVILWLGESNGYYGEDVIIEEVISDE